MIRTAIQLYTLRDVDEPVEALLDRVASAGYDGVEFAYRVETADPTSVASTLDETGLGVAGAHVSREALADDLDATVERADALDCDRLVLASLDASGFRTAEAVDDTATLLSDLADAVRARGLELCYHNHDHEFVDLDGSFAFERLIERADGVAFELDLGWVVAGGGDPAALLDRHGGRIPLVHVTDVSAGGDPVEVGDGVVDLDACAEAVRDAGVEWAIYEHDDPADPLESLGRGAAELERFVDR